MLRILSTRLQQGHRTNEYPREVPALPDRFRGRPTIDAARCPAGCRDCADACPTRAITLTPEGPRLDLGRCLFCTECSDACPEQAIRFTPEFRLATSDRRALVVGSAPDYALAMPLEEKRRRLYGRSLKLRVVSAGGCNGCEVDVNVLSTIVWDIARFGIQYVASPRHADGLLLCGPVTRNMELAVRETWDAIPEPRVCVAVGACAIAGGPYFESPEQLGGGPSLLPVDLFIPGCPPHPLTILDGMLRLIGLLDEGRQAAP